MKSHRNTENKNIYLAQKLEGFEFYYLLDNPRKAKHLFKDLSEKDKNLNVIWENVTKNGRSQVMVQEYIEEAAQGDNRLIFINYDLVMKHW